MGAPVALIEQLQAIVLPAKCAQYRNIRPFKKIEGLKCLCPLSNSLFEIQTYDGFLHCLHLADLGSNIGMFSVTAATLGRKVVAVDASIQNLAYIDKSVHLNGNQENVKLINNAVRCLDWSQYVKCSAVKRSIGFTIGFHI